VNIKNLPKISPYWRILLNQFHDSTLKILLVAATLTLIIGLYSADEFKWVEGASIYFAVVIIALFTAGADYAKNKQFLKLHDEIKNE
jgi:Ca2+-transporting ATPase